MPNVAVPTLPDSFWGLKFHQVAIYHYDPKAAVEMWIDLGYTNWHEDTALLKGSEWGEESSKHGHMFFNYDILPLELEYVRYTTSRRHTNDGRSGKPPFLSHLSVYVEDIGYEVARIESEYSWAPYHKFVTQDHTNPNVRGKKRFMEAIYNLNGLLGYDVKMIQRVSWDMPDDQVRAWAQGTAHYFAYQGLESEAHREYGLSDSQLESLTKEPKPFV